MIHGEEMLSILGDQVDLMDRTEVPDYFENLGICADCVMGVAHEWMQDNIPNVVAMAHEGGDVQASIEAFVLSAFVRGVSLGHFIGRNYKIEGR
jgi:hypothetical protein